MTHEDPEKKERLRMLNDALEASSLQELRKQIAIGVEAIAAPIVSKAIEDNPSGFDIVKSVAYALSLKYAVDRLGFPALTGFFEAYQALYFERDSGRRRQGRGLSRPFPQRRGSSQTSFGIVRTGPPDRGLFVDRPV